MTEQIIKHQLIQAIQSVLKEQKIEIFEKPTTQEINGVIGKFFIREIENVTSIDIIDNLINSNCFFYRYKQDSKPDQDFWPLYKKLSGELKKFIYPQGFDFIRQLFENFDSPFIKKILHDMDITKTYLYHPDIFTQINEENFNHYANLIHIHWSEKYQSVYREFFDKLIKNSNLKNFECIENFLLSKNERVIFNEFFPHNTPPQIEDITNSLEILVLKLDMLLIGHQTNKIDSITASYFFKTFITDVNDYEIEKIHSLHTKYDHPIDHYNELTLIGSDKIYLNCFSIALIEEYKKELFNVRGAYSKSNVDRQVIKDILTRTQSIYMETTLEQKTTTNLTKI